MGEFAIIDDPAPTAEVSDEERTKLQAWFDENFVKSGNVYVLRRRSEEQ